MGPDAGYPIRPDADVTRTAGEQPRESRLDTAGGAPACDRLSRSQAYLLLRPPRAEEIRDRQTNVGNL